MSIINSWNYLLRKQVFSPSFLVYLGQARALHNSVWKETYWNLLKNIAAACPNIETASLPSCSKKNLWFSTKCLLLPSITDTSRLCRSYISLPVVDTAAERNKNILLKSKPASAVPLDLLFPITGGFSLPTSMTLMPSTWHDSISGAMLELPACPARPRSQPLTSPLNVNLKLNLLHVTQIRRGHPLNIWLDKEAVCGKGTWKRGLFWICVVMLERYYCQFFNEIGNICDCSSGQMC